MSTRAVQALHYFAVDGLTVPQCAEKFGIREEAFEVMLLRAAEEFAAALSRAPGSATPPKKRRGINWRFAEESARAQRLRQALEGTAVPSEPTLLALRDSLQELRANGAAIKQLDQDALRQAHDSPKHAQELWLRRLLVLAVLALTGLMYARDKMREKPEGKAPVVQPKTGR